MAGGRSSPSPASRDIGYSGSNGTPYIDDNWQYQFTTNATWTRGATRIKFGGDIVRQALNRFETGSPSGCVHLRAADRRRSAAVPRRTSSTTSRRSCSASRHSVSKSLIPFEDNFTRSRNWQFSSVRRRTSGRCRGELTASLGVRWDRFPMGTRTTRGLERYDFDTNQMLICGEGRCPHRLRLRDGQGQLLAAARRRLARDRFARDARRLRHQLRSLSARLRPRHSRQLPVVDQADGVRAEHLPVRRAGSPTASRRWSCPTSAAASSRFRSTSPRARSIRSRSAATSTRGTSPCRRSCRWGFAGQVGLRRHAADRHQPDPRI